ncbi:MAG: hypothetical protein ACYCOU_07415 [Sulfobacillus sp.]
MKRFPLLLLPLILCVSAFFTPPAHAFSFSMPSLSASGVYGMVGAGVVNTQPNLSTPAGVLASTEGSPLNLQGVVGYQVNKYLGVEAEYNHVGYINHDWTGSVVLSLPLTKMFTPFVSAGNTFGYGGVNTFAAGVTVHTPLMGKHLFARVAYQYQRLRGNVLTRERSTMVGVGYGF